MAASRSDALLLFGVTGDLAHKMIFPALYAMVKRGDLKVPIIGVAFPKWSLERLHRRVTWKASLVPDLASSACVKSRRSGSPNCRCTSLSGHSRFGRILPGTGIRPGRRGADGMFVDWILGR
jgi:Glucose-6-phosphate dehydrogenase, NAD binding domain